jgi:hypothetical protein
MAIITLNNNSLSSVTTLPSGISGHNYPAFEAKLSASTNVSHSTTTKIQFDSEIFDTDGYYDNSTNYRFTPLVAGKYFVYTKIVLDSAASNMIAVTGYIYKNDALYTYGNINFDANDAEGGFVTLNSIIEFNGSTDYIDGRVNGQTRNSASPTLLGSANETLFGAYRIGD